VGCGVLDLEQAANLIGCHPLASNSLLLPGLVVARVLLLLLLERYGWGKGDGVLAFRCGVVFAALTTGSGAAGLTA
jgi:hypothetical protein